MVLICVFCGSAEIIHDPCSGYVVCGDCGSVLDTIYSYPAPRPGDRARPVKKAGREILRRRRAAIPAIAGWRLKKNLYISKDALQQFGGGARPLRVLRHPRESAAEELLMAHPHLRKILEVMEDYPRLYSRTLRGRVAVALIAYAIASGGEVDARKISDTFGLARPSVYRIYRRVLQHTSFISRVRASIGVGGNGEGK